MSTPPVSAFPQNASWNANLFGGPGVTVGSDILYPALRIVRILNRAGVGAQPEILTEAFAALNAMLDSWNTERLMIPAAIRTVFDITANTPSYSLGPAADWSTPVRPSRVEIASFISLNNPNQPLELPMEVLTLEGWKRQPVKAVYSTIALKLYYDQSLSLGNGTVYLWPIPSINNQIALYLWQQLTQFQAVEDGFALYQGYLRAIQYNLAVELTSRFENAVLTPVAAEIARTSKASIKALNAPSLEMRSDPALLTSGARFDWRTGQ